MRSSSHAAQGREADAKGDVAPVAVARDVSTGTGIAQTGLPRFARRFGALRFFNPTGGRIEKETGDPSAAAHGKRFDCARNKTWPGDGRIASGNSREAIA